MAAATLTTAALEIVLGVVLFVVRFSAYRAARFREVTGPLGSEQPYGESMVLGFTLLFGFCFTVWGLVAAGFFFEGMVRCAAGVAGLTLGSFPLWLLERAVSLAGVRRAPPPPPPDVRTPDGDGWIVESGVDRGWDEHTTFVVAGAQLRLLQVSQVSLGVRPFRYRLGPVPPGWIVRRLVALD